MKKTGTPTLALKWGTVKGWSDLTDPCADALQKWADYGVSLSAARQVNKPGQTQALCDAIDVIAAEGGTFYNDWSGEDMTADQAKSYIMEYGV